MFVCEAAVLISDDTTLMVGDTALLVCVTYGQDSAITWAVNGEMITNSTFAYIYEEDGNYGFLVVKHSFLELCGVATSDAGEYTCMASDSSGTLNATTRVSVAS